MLHSRPTCWLLTSPTAPVSNCTKHRAFRDLAISVLPTHILARVVVRIFAFGNRPASSLARAHVAVAKIGAILPLHPVSPIVLLTSSPAWLALWQFHDVSTVGRCVGTLTVGAWPAVGAAVGASVGDAGTMVQMRPVSVLDGFPHVLVAVRQDVQDAGHAADLVGLLL